MRKMHERHPSLQQNVAAFAFPDTFYNPPNHRESAEMIAQDLTASSELAQFNPVNNVLQENDSVMNMSYANQMKLKGYAKKRNSVSTTK